MSHKKQPQPLNLSSSASTMPPQPSASITHNNSRVTATLPTGESVEVLLYGATIISWKDAKGDEKLWLSEKADLSGGKAVRGGVPLVFPVFGPPPSDHPTSSLPQHGFARTSRWEFLGKSSTESDSKDGLDTGIKLDFGLGPENLSAEAKKAWTGSFGLIYSVTLTRGSLRTSIVVRNEGEEAWEFMLLFHTYLRVGDIEKTTLKGLGSAEYVDKVAKTTTTQQSDDLTLSGETDRVYTPSSVEAPLTVTVNGSPRFEVTRETLQNVVVWNPWIEKAKGMGDFEPKDGWKQMLCVEAGQVGGWTKLDGGDAWEGGVTVKALL